MNYIQEPSKQIPVVGTYDVVVAGGGIGFAVKNASIAAYDSAYVDWGLGIFMILFGVNFNLYYLIVLRKLGTALRSEELHWYLGIIAFAVITIAVNINSIYGSVHQSVRHQTGGAAFQADDAPPDGIEAKIMPFGVAVPAVMLRAFSAA